MKMLFSRPLITATKLVTLLGILFSLSGCLITSPFWNQEFANHSTTKIPLQAWTTSTSGNVVFECSPAYHGGLYPPFDTPTWTNVANVIPDVPGVLDPAGTRIYSAAHHQVLPAACWHQDSNGLWYSAVRATQSSTTFQTVDKVGLECVGRENGKAASWFGWLGKGCAKTYSNSSTVIPFVIFRAAN